MQFTEDNFEKLLAENKKLKESVIVWRDLYNKFRMLWAEEYWIARDNQYAISNWLKKYGGTR